MRVLINAKGKVGYFLSILQVDLAKCTRCGLCSGVCPSRIIEQRENGPELTSSARYCIGCGHCVAVCPTAALNNRKSPLANQLTLEEYPLIDADTAYKFLRSRRSVRMYKKEAVKRDTMIKLLDAARFAQSPGNLQGLSYMVIDDPAVLQKIIPVVIDFLEMEHKSGAAWAIGYDHQLEHYRKTKEDIILRGAPTLVLVLTDKDITRAWGTARISLTYAELYATALGLGTVWGGYIENCASRQYQPFLDLINLPEGQKVCGALMVGYPRVQYKRMVDRKPLRITWGTGEQISYD